MHKIVDDSLINMDEFWGFLLTLDNIDSGATSVNKSNESSLAGDLLPLTPIHNTILSSSFKNTSVRNMRRINSTNKNNFLSCKKVISFSEDSPIATVLNSVTGSTLSKLRKNQQLINSQKERIDQMETELESYADKCEYLKNLVDNLEASKKRYNFFKKLFIIYFALI